MENFRQFCINITNPEIPDTFTTECECDASMVSSIDTITTDIKRKINFLDNVSIPYIESRFEKLDKLEKIFDYMEIDDIPDTLMNYVSDKVYGVIFNQLSNDKRSIIAVLSVYILIYNSKGGILL